MANGWVVNGRKRWASLAPALSYVYSLVTVIDGDQPPRRGNLLVPTSTPGVRIEETWDNLGMRATASHDIVFEQVIVPHEALLPSDASGVPGDGTGWWTFPVQAVYLGIATGARDAAVKFAKERVPNGMTGPIAELQTIQHKVAEMELLLWQSRSVLYDTAERYLAQPERRDELAWELAAVKYTVSNNAIKVTDLALRVVGSVGLGRTLPIERHFRDARTSLGHPPMDDAALTLIGKTALGLSTGGQRTCTSTLDRRLLPTR
jgi:alkylation response protein AidB-like acyl-CoA dehydrogenase